MRIWLILLIVAVSVGVAIGALVALQRHARTGFFRDSHPAGAALQVSGTIFAVIVGFVLLLAFQSYVNAREAAQDEASATEALFEIGALLPAPARGRVQGDLICYGRSVVDAEWPAMADGPAPSPVTDAWVEEARRGFAALPAAATDTAAGESWLARGAARQQAREARLGEAEPLVPTTVWILLLLGGISVVGSVLLFADRRERLWPAAAVVAAVTTLVVSSLLIVAFLDGAYGSHAGAVTPRAMEGSLANMEREWLDDAPAEALPCDASGRAKG